MSIHSAEFKSTTFLISKGARITPSDILIFISLFKDPCKVIKLEGILNTLTASNMIKIMSTRPQMDSTFSLAMASAKAT